MRHPAFGRQLFFRPHRTAGKLCCWAGLAAFLGLLAGGVSAGRPLSTALLEAALGSASAGLAALWAAYIVSVLAHAAAQIVELREQLCNTDGLPAAETEGIHAAHVAKPASP